MGRTGNFEPALLFMGLLYPAAESGAAEEAWSRCAGRWGPEGLRSPEIPFTWSSYYDAEMGAPILRSLRCFREPVDPSGLAEAKIFTNQVETDLAREGRRRVNLDPGLLFPSRLILATTKDRAHRIPLRDGIFAELTLLYEKGGWRPLPWTYPDYRTPEYAESLTRMREIFRARRKRAT